MPDRFFYPLVVLVMLGAVAAALAPGPGRVNEAASGQTAPGDAWIVRGEALRGLGTGDGIGYEPVSEESGPLFVRARASKTADTPPLSAGLFADIPEELEMAFAGRPLRVSILARARGANAADRFRLGYFTTDERADSGWRDFQPTGEFETYSFTFTPGEKTGEPNMDYLGVWPDAEGRNGTLEIVQMAVRPANAPAADEEEAGS